MIKFVDMKATRTNIVLQDDLVGEAMSLSRASSKKEMIETAIKEYIRWMKRQKLSGLKGKIQWDGDLTKMRTARIK